MTALALALACAGGSAQTNADAEKDKKRETPPAGPVQVTVLELNDPAAYVLQVSGEQMRRRVTLTYDGKKIQGPLEVEVSTLDADGGLFIEPTLTLPLPASALPPSPGRSVTVASAVPPVSVDLAATLPHVGDYGGYLRFKLGAQDYQYKRLRITRTVPSELPLELGAQPRMGAKTFAATDLLAFTVRGLVDRDVVVQPTLLSLTLKSGAVASYDQATFSPTELSVKKGRSAALTMALNGLDPGEYSGKLALSADAYRDKEQAFSFSTRYPWWAALGLTALGALMSLIVKRLSTDLRPRLVVRANALGLVEKSLEISHQFPLEPGESAVLFAIQSRIRAVYNDAIQPGPRSADWVTSMTGKLDADKTKLSAFVDWVNASRMLESVSGLDATTRTDFQTRLDAARRALQADPPMAPAVLTDVEVLAGDIESQKDALAEQALTSVSQAIDKQAAVPAEAADPAAPLLEEAQLRAEQAREMLTRRNYAGFQQAYDAAGLAYYKGLGQRLAGTVDRAADGEGASAEIARTVQRATPAGLHLQALDTTGDLAHARAHYSAAAAAITDSAGGADVMSAHFPLVRPSAPDAVPDTGLHPQRPVLPPLDTGFVESQRALLDEASRLGWAIDLFAVATAGLLGVTLVWLPNAGWGQPSDLIAALLWGLGLQQVGASTFEGILGLRTKVTGV